MYTNVYNHIPDGLLRLFIKWTEWTKMNFFLNASEMTQNDQESVQIYAYCNPAILWTQDRMESVWDFGDKLGLVGTAVFSPAEHWITLITVLVC